ncbi:MAG: peptidase U32 family protein [bacterium]
MEILAPLRNSLRLLKKVLNAGADSVYFGVKPQSGKDNRYSLMWTPMEFDLESALEAINITARAGRRSYITLNVPYPQARFEAVFDLSCRLIEAGASALIVSDPGLMWRLKEEKPDAELHVSIFGRTVNSQTAIFYKKLGAKKIILERALTIEEIKPIKERADIDVEVFIYGNFCFFYHGGCRISSYFYGEQCIGPCTDEYQIESLPEAGNRPFRSKPLNGYGLLSDLYRAGVAAIKIEGRHKTDRYILDSLRVLRPAVDSLKQGRPLPRALKNSGLFILPPESTEGFFTGPPVVGDTIDCEDSLAGRIRHFRTYFTFAGLLVALQMRKLKKEARRFESCHSNKQTSG